MAPGRPKEWIPVPSTRQRTLCSAKAAAEKPPLRIDPDDAYAITPDPGLCPDESSTSTFNAQLSMIHAMFYLFRCQSRVTFSVLERPIFKTSPLQNVNTNKVVLERRQHPRLRLPTPPLPLPLPPAFYPIPDQPILELFQDRIRDVVLND